MPRSAKKNTYKMPPGRIYDDRPMVVRSCDCPGCIAPGDYRAPRDRELSGYYHFCLDHVRDYNRNWDYFAGMNQTQIENYNRSAGVWERPSWPMGDWQQREQKLRDQVFDDFFGGEGSGTAKPGATVDETAPIPKVERDALAVLDLAPPVDFAAVKLQYRALVKRHHPDTNGGSREAEERFKSINQAFTLLKQIYSVEDAT